MNEFKLNPLDAEPDVAVGITLPFTQKNGRLFKSSYTTAEQAKTNLISLLLTRKGERFLQPSFGTDISNFVFEQISESNITKLERSIRNDILYWLPYIEVIDFDVREAKVADMSGVYITFKYKINDNDSEIEIVLFSDINGTRVL